MKQWSGGYERKIKAKSGLRCNTSGVLGVLGRPCGVFRAHDSRGAALGVDFPKQPRIRGCSMVSGVVRGCFQNW